MAQRPETESDLLTTGPSMNKQCLHIFDHSICVTIDMSSFWYPSDDLKHFLHHINRSGNWDILFHIPLAGPWSVLDLNKFDYARTKHFFLVQWLIIMFPPVFVVVSTCFSCWMITYCRVITFISQRVSSRRLFKSPPPGEEGEQVGSIGV